MQVDEIKTKHEALKESIRQLVTQYQEETGCEVSLVVHNRKEEVKIVNGEPLRVSELYIDLTTVIE